jgi:DHA1 family bicyclomycin/chloramphenicol resistance-like MFS transporter
MAKNQLHFLKTAAAVHQSVSGRVHQISGHGMNTSRVSYEQIALYACLTSITALSIDALLPALRAIEADVPSTSLLSTQHIVSLFILGMVFGELLFGPLSDAIGRKKALVGGLVLYIAGTTLGMFANSLEVVILGRILQGVGVAGPKIATRAMIRDQFEGDAMARVMSFVFTLIILVPMVAPAFGQLVLVFAGWRAIFVVYVLMAVILCLWLISRQAETLPRSRRVPLRPAILFRNAFRILSNRRVAFLIIATGFIFGGQLLYLSTAAELFFDVFGIAETFPLYFAALAVGVGIASFTNAQLVRRFGMDAMVRWAVVGLMLSGGVMLAASAIFAGRPPLMLFMASGFIVFFCIGILFGNLNAMTMRSLGQLAGLGASLIASGSSLIAVVFATCLGSFYNQTTFPVAAGFALSGVLSFALVALASRADIKAIEPVRSTD